MDYTQLTQAVGTLGFPIVAYGLMFWFNVKIVSELRDVVSKNTEAINNLLDVKEK